MKITILTIFPELFQSFLEAPVTKRVRQRHIAEINIIDLKQYADGSFRHIDDSPYGGGAGMILKCDPVFRCLKEARSPASHVIAFTPAGKPYTQKRAHELAEMDDIILLCGHYEGMDERIMTAVDEQISVGDYILTGGELPAMTVTDSIVRLLDGALRKESTQEESFEQKILEYPQYTKPYEYEGMKVPEVLLSGNHQKIAAWRHKEALRKTLHQRPDLLHDLGDADQEILNEIKEEDNL
ncbi:MAG: tRNA (guanosine(37)-N1)-methyltransferase TrmD [Bulleidia sp.]|nr:tRNA (guanosine(37)-N1)-methyltransferase TrmD [Bulleidia sp.]